MRINSVFFALIIIILMIIPFKGISQVKSINQKLSNLNPRYRFAKAAKVINVSKDDIKQLLKQDSIESKEGYPFRFGKGIKVDIDFFSDASIHSKGDTTFYYYEIKSPSAFSINLIFDHFKLNNNSYLNIYNSDQSFFYGAITSKDIPQNGIFWTDLIKGDHIILELPVRSLSSANYGLANQEESSDSLNKFSCL